MTTAEVAESAIKPGSVVDNHSSRPCVTARLKQHTRGRVEQTHSPPIWPCSEWGLPCPATLSPQAVGSYPAVSPLPRTAAILAGRDSRSAVCSLLHWPSARAAQALPGTLLCGARTFLGAVKPRRGCLGRLRRPHYGARVVFRPSTPQHLVQPGNNHQPCFQDPGQLEMHSDPVFRGAGPRPVVQGPCVRGQAPDRGCAAGPGSRGRW